MVTVNRLKEEQGGHEDHSDKHATAQIEGVYKDEHVTTTYITVCPVCMSIHVTMYLEKADTEVLSLWGGGLVPEKMRAVGKAAEDVIGLPIADVVDNLMKAAGIGDG